jgi:hypothetical protein
MRAADKDNRSSVTAGQQTEVLQRCMPWLK